MGSLDVVISCFFPLSISQKPFTHVQLTNKTRFYFSENEAVNILQSWGVGCQLTDARKHFSQSGFFNALHQSINQSMHWSINHSCIVPSKHHYNMTINGLHYYHITNVIVNVLWTVTEDPLICTALFKKWKEFCARTILKNKKNVGTGVCIEDFVLELRFSVSLMQWRRKCFLPGEKIFGRGYVLVKRISVSLRWWFLRKCSVLSKKAFRKNWKTAEAAKNFSPLSISLLNQFLPSIGIFLTKIPYL